MWRWLNGPGKVFRKALPGSTNYMNAYDKQGNLLRTRNAGREAGSRRNKPEEETLEEDEETAARRDLENPDLTDEEPRDEESDARGGIPKERRSDMRPYPLNDQFSSQAVLSEELREELYTQVAVYKHDISSVAASFSVDIRRVAAVVRLKTIEKQWVAEGKRLAKPYSEAVLAMLPTTPFRPNTANPVTPHEPINDIEVHAHTRPQIFWPASESRQFTREDAAKVFDSKLLPADKRIPLPMLVDLERWKLEGLDRQERTKKQIEADDKARREEDEKVRKRTEWQARTQRVVQGRRWDFKFQDISAEKVGKDGRGKDAVGYRYGMPHEDRKRGMLKIPTSVE
ncbi:hypothetical protein BAUCODRAFT_75161 [Baudoinia panamericana UAMH 10762]|uniref:Uncharacterized protein n=1 Tax=Baudoinia panamericana (strain UAMH 10762) TaxID=717646 RepID=M2N4R9_BAUPA|nr:uncharacterized protein BAUCODRAFT_75161 [Baudoinia panamericana UAMH 10762]EMC93745.1 hypothetical protein BAUCODRAFT_75161 [Baudoinia panamericana UAMH 10762]